MEPATTIRFRNALVFLRHQLRNSCYNPSKYQRRTNVNVTDGAIKKGFFQDSVKKFINQGLGDMKHIEKPRPGLLKTLEERGFLGQFHGNTEEFIRLSDQEVLHIYAGADATAPSLHFGHLMVIMPMIHCMLHSHKVTFLVGTATARIGDPSGRATEREGMKDQALGQRTWNNGREITDQLSAMLKSTINRAVELGYNRNFIGRRSISDNINWHRNVSIIDFFQIIGPRARIGEMMLRKSVSERMKSKEGISYAEFSYQLIQALDYWHLFSSLGCRLQIGGSDQWGNITAGCDLINKMVNEQIWIDEQPTPSLIRNMAKPYGLTVPLLTNSSGEKISKSTLGNNGIWLNSIKTPPFTLYQFLLRSPDDVMEQWLKYFTILPLSEIAEIMKLQTANPEQRHAQKRLAFEVVALMHSTNTARICEETTATFFGQTSDEKLKSKAENKLKQGLTITDLHGVSDNRHWEPVLWEDVVEQPLETILVAGKIATSKTQARTLIKSGALSMGPHLEKVNPNPTEPHILSRSNLIIGGNLTAAVFKVGKNSIHIVRLEDNLEKIEELDRLRSDVVQVTKERKKKEKLTKKEKRKQRKRTQHERLREKRARQKAAWEEMGRVEEKEPLEDMNGLVSKSRNWYSTQSNSSSNPDPGPEEGQKKK
ncbi:hypothetical protein ABW19_dt0205089 [Dactylella cylindrospora]|nr:hypothetical protein ABW19_dt0205089 [Dactylella cylindrospora]